MPAHRDFDVPERDPAAKGPTFTLAGESFTCLPEMPAGPWMAVPNDLGGQAAIAGAFILGCLLPEEEERFQVTTANKDRIVTLSVMHDILRWLLNEAWAADPPAEG